MTSNNKPTPQKDSSIGQSIQLSLSTPPTNQPQNNNTYERSIMTEPSVMVKTERIAVGAVSTNLAKLSDIEAEKYLYNMMRVDEVAVRLELDQNETFDIILTHDLLIKSIRTQKALNELIIGDQLLLVNGKAPINIEHAAKLLSRAMPVLNLVVGRVAYKRPIPLKRANAIQLKRQQNYSYFIATVQLVGRVHLGLGIKTQRGKTTVSRTDQNSLVAYVLLLGDSILDINGEKFTDSTQLRDKMIRSLKTCGQFNAIVEREDPTLATHHVQWSADKSNSNQNADPQMSIDINQICQRELVRFRLCTKRMKRNKKGGILKFNEDAALMKTQGDDVFDKNEAKTLKTAASDSDSRRKVRVRRSSSKSRSKREDDISNHLSSFFDRTKKKKKKKISIQTKYNEEEKISTDIQNPILLQHVQTANKQALLTFLPKLFRM